MTEEQQALNEDLKTKGTKKRVLLINNYPMDHAEELYQKQEYPAHHLWGANELRAQGFDVDILPFEIWKSLKESRYGDLDQTLRSALRAHRYDVIYAACLGTSRWLAKARKLGLLYTPVVCVAYTTRTARAFLQGHDKVICLSEHIENALAGSQKAKSSQLCNARWGPDLDYFDKIKNEVGASQDYIISAGKTRRDYRTLVAAANDGAFNLFLSTNQRALQDVGPLPPNVTVRDSWVDSRSIVEELCRATAVAIPVDKNQGEATDLLGYTSLLDALALGKPVVMTRNPLFDIDIEAIGCGFWVDHQDVDGWRKALNVLAQNPERAAEMGARGRAYCESSCSLKRFGDQLANIFSPLHRARFETPA